MVGYVYLILFLINNVCDFESFLSHWNQNFYLNLNFCYVEKEFIVSVQCLNFFLTEYNKMSRCSSTFSDPVGTGVTPSSELRDSSLTGSRI